MKVLVPALHPYVRRSRIDGDALFQTIGIAFDGADGAGVSNVDDGSVMYVHRSGVVVYYWSLFLASAEKIRTSEAASSIVFLLSKGAFHIHIGSTGNTMAGLYKNS